MNTKLWIHGLGAAFIGGTSAALVSLGAAYVTTGLNLLELKKIGAAALFAGMITAAGYLKQSPLPASQITVTETASKTLEVTKDKSS